MVHAFAKDNFMRRVSAIRTLRRNRSTAINRQVTMAVVVHFQNELAIVRRNYIKSDRRPAFAIPLVAIPRKSVLPAKAAKSHAAAIRKGRQTHQCTE